MKVDAAIWESKVPCSYVEEVGQWAAYLHVRGWFEDAKDRAELTFGGDLWKSEKQIIREERAEAMGLLREAELVPKGLAGWFIVRFILLPFLGRLLQSILFETED